MIFFRSAVWMKNSPSWIRYLPLIEGCFPCKKKCVGNVMPGPDCKAKIIIKNNKKRKRKKRQQTCSGPVGESVCAQDVLRCEVCSHYNKGSGPYGACTFKATCTKLHICQHFIQDDCRFGHRCKRLHAVDEYGRRMLEERGLSGEIIHDLPFIYKNVYRLSLNTPYPEREGMALEPMVRPAPQSEERTEICLHFLRRNCRFQDQCIRIHFNLPYKWEVFDGECWRDLRHMEEIERAYCDPRNTHSPGSRPVDFLTMIRDSDPVRRLSTASSVNKPPHYILTTQWLWYYKGDHENWIEYGKADDKQRVTSLTSRDLEVAYLTDCNAEITVMKGHRQYYLSFQDMYQRNPKHNTKRKVRRRPRFVSITEVEEKIAR